MPSRRSRASCPRSRCCRKRRRGRGRMIPLPIPAMIRTRKKRLRMPKSSPRTKRKAKAWTPRSSRSSRRSLRATSSRRNCPRTSARSTIRPCPRMKSPSTASRSSASMLPRGPKGPRCAAGCKRPAIHRQHHFGFRCPRRADRRRPAARRFADRQQRRRRAEQHRLCLHQVQQYEHRQRRGHHRLGRGVRRDSGEPEGLCERRQFLEPVGADAGDPGQRAGRVPDDGHDRGTAHRCCQHRRPRSVQHHHGRAVHGGARRLGHGRQCVDAQRRCLGLQERGRGHRCDPHHRLIGVTNMQKSIEHSHIGPRQVGPVAMTAQDAADYQALSAIGVNFAPSLVAKMAQAMAMDDNQTGITSPSIITPIQFLQNWLPGFIRIITAARKIDELVGITTSGSWEDEEIVQGTLENIGNAMPYGDYSNVPLASWNVNFERRTVVRFEKGIKVGMLEEARAARIRMNTAAEKRASASLALEIQRNLIGFNGYNNGANLTYGFLNDPSLPAYYTVANGATSGSPLWSTKTFQDITADIRKMMATLQTGSQDTINPEDAETTLAVPTAVYQYLSVTTDLGLSVRKWLTETYPRCRVVSAPQLNAT